MDTALGIDIGGSHVAAAAVAGDGTVAEYESVPASGDGEAVVGAALALASDLIGPAVKAVGVGLAGLVDHTKGVFRWGPNVPGTDIAVHSRFAAELGLPVTVDNEVNLAAFGEWSIGAATGNSHVLMVTLGSGIGGGLLIDGRIYRGAGFAGEIGHICVEPGGRLCSCGQHGCWEAYASGRRLDEMARRLAAAHPAGAVARLAGGQSASGRHLATAAVDEDHGARHAVSELGHWIGVGLANLIAVLDPQIIVLGGAVAGIGAPLLTDVRHVTRAHLEGRVHRAPTPIVPAALGDRAGVVGAALYALHTAAAT